MPFQLVNGAIHGGGEIVFPATFQNSREPGLSEGLACFGFRSVNRRYRRRSLFPTGAARTALAHLRDGDIHQLASFQFLAPSCHSRDPNQTSEDRNQSLLRTENAKSAKWLRQLPVNCVNAHGRRFADFTFSRDRSAD